MTGNLHCQVLGAEVDLECQQDCGPVAGLGPGGDGVGEREVDQLAGGVLVGEVALGLDRLAQLAGNRSRGLILDQVLSGAGIGSPC